jgi:hypothetical protein
VTRRPTPLPEHLAIEPFRTQAATAAGVGRSRLRAGDLDASVRGARSPRPLLDLASCLRLLAVALPDDIAFSHLTAARLWGMPDLPRAPEGEPVDVMRDSAKPPIVRAGCRSHRGLTRRSTERVAGLRVVSRIDTWADLAPVLTTTGLVVIGDALSNGRIGARVRLEDLHRVFAAQRGCRGVVRLDEALALVRPGSASPMESRTRLVFRSWGLPEPQLNVNIYDERGEWLAKPDFVWRGARVVAEYDGDHHRTDPDRWQYERGRRLRLEAAGWSYVELTWATLSDPELRTELRTRLHALLG